MTTANKRGHMYVFPNKDLLLYLGHGALVRTGSDAPLDSVHGHVYMHIGLVNLTSGYDTLVADNVNSRRWARVNQQLANVLTKNFTSIEPTELRMNARQITLIDLKVLRNPKHGVDVGQVTLADTVMLTTGHDYVTMDNVVPYNTLVRAYVGDGSQTPLMFMASA